MVLLNIPMPSFEAIRPLDIGERWVCEPALGHDDQGSSQAVIDQCVSRYSEWLDSVQSLTARFERLHQLAKSQPDIKGLDKASEDLLLDKMYQIDLHAEICLDYFEFLDCRILELERWHDKGMVWNQAAGDLLQELRRLRTLLKENVATMRRWSSQFCDEYERRHPELPQLPFEPLDLGPTNSARLPPVL